jgi:hypothetical protein
MVTTGHALAGRMVLAPFVKVLNRRTIPSEGSGRRTFVPECLSGLQHVPGHRGVGAIAPLSWLLAQKVTTYPIKWMGRGHQYEEERLSA